MPRGSRPGERRGGRKTGTPNKATADVRVYAGKYTKEAIEGLVKLARTAESEQARVSSWREVLDRAVGRPAQAVTDPDGNALSIPAQVLIAISKASDADCRD